MKSFRPIVVWKDFLCALYEDFDFNITLQNINNSMLVLCTMTIQCYYSVIIVLLQCYEAIIILT